MDNNTFIKESGSVWAPVFTLTRNEKKIYTNFQQEGIPAYLPLKRHVNIQPVVSKGKSYCYKRILHVPMFPNYLFARISPEIRSGLARNRSIVRILPVTAIEEDHLLEELNVIRQLEIYSETKPVDVANGLKTGKKVMFTEGPFAGWHGVISSLKQNGLVSINITCIQASVSMEYPAAWCKEIED